MDCRVCTEWPEDSPAEGAVESCPQVLVQAAILKYHRLGGL